MVKVLRAGCFPGEALHLVPGMPMAFLVWHSGHRESRLRIDVFFSRLRHAGASLMVAALLMRAKENWIQHD